MARKSKSVEAYKDVRELNWEETEQENSTEGLTDTGLENIPASWGVLERLALYLEKVDPEIRSGNPVIRWALCDDHCTFVFRSGQKAVIYTRELS